MIWQFACGCVGIPENPAAPMDPKLKEFRAMVIEPCRDLTKPCRDLTEPKYHLFFRGIQGRAESLDRDKYDAQTYQLKDQQERDLLAEINVALYDSGLLKLLAGRIGNIAKKAKNRDVEKK